MKGWAISLAVCVAASLSGLSLAWGVFVGAVVLGHPLLFALGSLGLFALSWALDRRVTQSWALRALWFGLHVGGAVAVGRFFAAFGEGSQ